jgi:hypothetical protein
MSGLAADAPGTAAAMPAMPATLSAAAAVIVLAALVTILKTLRMPFSLRAPGLHRLVKLPAVAPTLMFALHRWSGAL